MSSKKNTPPPPADHPYTAMTSKIADLTETVAKLEEEKMRMAFALKA